MSAIWPVRGFQAGDAPELARVHKEAMAPQGQRGWNAAEIATLAEAPASFGLVVPGPSPAAAPILGFILVRTIAGEAEVLTLAVTPGAQRHGIGSALLDRAAKEAAAQGATRLLLEVSVENSAALALYERAGFRGMGVRPRYYRRVDGTEVDALVLSRTL